MGLVFALYDGPRQIARALLDEAGGDGIGWCTANAELCVCYS